MKIAFIGQKGIPCIWGGVENHVENISLKLSQQGKSVIVYVRNWYTPKNIKEHQAVKLVHLPTIQTKYLDAFVHTFICTIHALFQNCDIIHYQAIGPGFFCWLPRLFGIKTVVTIHRLDYEDGKWGWFSRGFLKFSEFISLKYSSEVTVVSRELENFYRKKGYKTNYIPNGVNKPIEAKADVITKKYNLSSKSYILACSRFAPAKRIDWIIKAYQSLDEPRLKLVIAGGTTHLNPYARHIARLARNDKNILFTGFVSGREKEELFSNARFFIHASLVEGLPIALLEAMSYGIICIASNIGPHSEIIKEGDNGFLFKHDDFKDLVQKINYAINLNGDDIFGINNQVARESVTDYNWQATADNTSKIYSALVAK
ncbi:MAG: glycosyltransferase family 4 protein [Candidatus Omnitrophica bacterium]|nr:glycosyltransferase family 4 protein [Candidatus Omnitrophota bacterium]